MSLPSGDRPAMLRWLGVACFAALTAGPVLLLAWDTAWAGDALAMALPSGRRLSLLWSSVALGAAVALGGTVAGMVCAVALWRQPRARVLRWVALAMAASPPYVHYLAWSGFARTFGVPFEGWPAIWWVQTASFLPFGVLLLLAAFETLDPGLIEAGRMARPEHEALLRVALPLAAPAAAACGGLLFLLSVTDYSVPALLQRSVYALAIFSEYSAGGDVRRAFAMSLPLIVLSCGAAAAANGMLRGEVFTPAWGVSPWSRGPRVADRIGLALLALHALVPLVSLAADAAGWSALARAAFDSRREIGLTMGTAAAAAVLSLGPGWAVARSMERTPSLLWLLVLAPLVVPPPVAGLGLIRMWNGTSAFALHGTLAMPVLALLARFLPVAALGIAAHLRRIDPLLLDAARLQQAPGWKIRLRIHLPLVLPGAMAAAFFVFALGAGELGATLMIAPPGYQTLSVRIFNYLHYGSSPAVANLCLVLMALGLAAGGAAAWVAERWSRIAGTEWRARA